MYIFERKRVSMNGDTTASQPVDRDFADDRRAGATGGGTAGDRNLRRLDRGGDTLRGKVISGHPHCHRHSQPGHEGISGDKVAAGGAMS